MEAVLDREILTAAPPGVAKWAHLRSVMAMTIEAGHWPAGWKLPPETEIAATSGYSLGTVQRALRELVAQGYVLRRQGAGTFVADLRKQMDQPLHCRFVPYGETGVLPVYTRLVGRARTDVPAPWAEVLGFDARGAVVLDRTLDIGGRFSVASRMYLRASDFGQLMNLPRSTFDGVNLKKLLADEFGILVRRVEQRFRVEVPDAPLCRWLGRRELTSVLAIRACGLRADGTPAYVQHLWAPPTVEELCVDSLVE